MLARGLFNVDQAIVYCWVGWLTCCKCIVYVSLVPLCGSAIVFFWFGYISFLLDFFLNKKTLARLLFTFGLDGLQLASVFFILVWPLRI